jgi:L-alanine-DL-glutamate epimerase-like enolase superfamily enzyme
MFCHNGCTPVGTIASGHACLTIKSFITLESDSVELSFWKNLVHREGNIIKEGYQEIPNKPGLGIQLNEDVCRKHLAERTSFFKSF